MFGHVIPDHWDPKIAVHFAHRVGALVVSLAVIATSMHVWYHHPRRRTLTRPATLLLGLVAVQVTLGALTVLTRRDVWINSVHLVCGALVLATSIVITLRSWRVKFAPADSAVPAAAHAGAPRSRPAPSGARA
jgi:heme a synthase